MQSNQDIIDSNFNIIDDSVWQVFLNKLEHKDSLDNMTKYVQHISITYNIDKKNIIKNFLNYIIRTQPSVITPKFLSFVENVIHFQDYQINHCVNYVLTMLLRTMSISTSKTAILD